MSKFKLLNMFILQWFFIRICYFVHDDGFQFAWGFLFPVVPLTGWRSYVDPLNGHKFSNYIPKKPFNIVFVK